MKKVISLVLALMMILSLSVTAFAADDHDHTITINNPHDGYVYAAYQIFSGDLGKDGVLSNVEWGTGVNGAALLAELKATTNTFKDCTDAASVAVALANFGAMDDPKAVAFAEVVRKHVTTTFKTSNDIGTQYVIEGLKDGYYMVVNTTVPAGENTAYSRYILEVVANVTVAHKGTYPTVEKKIVEGETLVDTNEAAIGEAVNYQITGTIPANIGDYSEYYYVFTDTLSKGLTYNNNMVVTVNGVDVTEYFYIDATHYSETTGTTITVGIEDLLALENLTTPAVGAITANTKVVLTYSATLNENAIVAVEGNPNDVQLEYDNNPNDDGNGTTTPPPPNPDKPEPEGPTGETPKDEVETYTTRLRIFKMDGQGNKLTGAEFTLSGDAVKTMVITRETFVVAGAGETAVYYELKDGTFTTTAPVFVDDPATDDVDERTDSFYASTTPTHVLKVVTETQTKTESVNVKSFVGEDGYVIFNGLSAGTYTLTESVTPDGFNTIAPIEFTITFDHTKDPMFECSNSFIMDGSGEFVNGFYAEIKNVAGTTLPSTGGMGTTLFYILGGLMVTGAAVLLITKKRMAV